jgi:hypothetical protein
MEDGNPISGPDFRIAADIDKFKTNIETRAKKEQRAASSCLFFFKLRNCRGNFGHFLSHI